MKQAVSGFTVVALALYLAACAESALAPSDQGRDGRLGTDLNVVSSFWKPSMDGVVYSGSVAGPVAVAARDGGFVADPQRFRSNALSPDRIEILRQALGARQPTGIAPTLSMALGSEMPNVSNERGKGRLRVKMSNSRAFEQRNRDGSISRMEIVSVKRGNRSLPAAIAMSVDGKMSMFTMLSYKKYGVSNTPVTAQTTVFDSTGVIALVMHMDFSGQGNVTVTKGPGVLGAVTGSLRGLAKIGKGLVSLPDLHAAEPDALATDDTHTLANGETQIIPEGCAAEWWAYAGAWAAVVASGLGTIGTVLSCGVTGVSCVAA